MNRILPFSLWPVVAYLGGLYALPLVRLLRLSVMDPAFTVRHYSRIVSVPVYLGVLINTFEIALMVAAIAMVLAYPTAYLLSTSPPRRAAFLLVFVVVPFFTSDLVRNYSWIFLLGSRGVINTTLISLGLIREPVSLMFNRFGVLVGMVHVLLPYMILLLLSVMRGIDPRTVAAAGSLGAAPFVAFRRVFLPLSLPGVAGAFLLVFVLALAFFVTPAMLGGGPEIMIANVIASQVAFLNWGFASALATVLLTVTLVLILAIQWLFGGVGLVVPGLRTAVPAQRQKGMREGPVLWMLDRLFNGIWPYVPPIVGGAVMIYLFLPILIIFPLSVSSAQFFVFPPPGFSLQWYRAFVQSPVWLSATWNSFVIGALTSVLTMAIAVPAALGITRSRSKVAVLVYMFMLSPMIVPGIITAIAIFFLFSKLHLTGSVLGVVLGHTIGSLPLAAVVMVAALRNFDMNVERAALSLGASPSRAVVRVTLPMLSTAFLVAALFAFLHSFNDLLIALFVSGITARTLPKKMWESLSEINPTIAAVSALLVVFTILALAVLSGLQKRGFQKGTSQRAGAQ